MSDGYDCIPSADSFRRPTRAIDEHQAPDTFVTASGEQHQILRSPSGFEYLPPQPPNPRTFSQREQIAAAMRYIEHSVYVQIRQPGGFFASCRSCGADHFPTRTRLSEAESDARAHGWLDHIYPLERLVAHDEKVPT